MFEAFKVYGYRAYVNKKDIAVYDSEGEGFTIYFGRTLLTEEKFKNFLGLLKKAKEDMWECIQDFKSGNYKL
jgi:hypothetical protein